MARLLIVLAVALAVAVAVDAVLADPAGSPRQKRGGINFQGSTIDLNASSELQLQGGNLISIGGNTKTTTVDPNTAFVVPTESATGGTFVGLKCYQQGQMVHNVPDDGVNPPEICFCSSSTSSSYLVFHCVPLSA